MGSKQAKSNQEVLIGEMAEAWWKDYDEVIARICPDYEEGLNALVRGIPAHSRIITEIGTGTGNLTARIAQAFPHARIKGIDNDESMLARARVKLEPYHNVELINQTAQNANYDCVYTVASSLVFHLMKNEALKRMLQKIHDSRAMNIVVFDRVRGETMTEEEIFLAYFAQHLHEKELPVELRAQLVSESINNVAHSLSWMRRKFEEYGFRLDVLRQIPKHGFVVYKGTRK